MNDDDGERQLSTAEEVVTPKTAQSSSQASVSTDEDLKDYPTGFRLFIIFVPLVLCTFLCAIDGTILATAVPTITAQFNSLPDLAWYNSAFLLTTCAFQLPFGRMYALLNIKWTYLTAVVLFEIGSAVCGSAPSSIALIIGRAIAGIGGAGIFGGAMIIIAEVVPLSKRALYVGALGGTFAVASVVGPLLGGAFTSNVSWRWCFYINLPLGVVAMVAGVVYLPNDVLERNKDPARLQNKTWKQIVRKFDPLGTAILIPSLICLLLALQWGGQTYSWSNGRVIALLVVFAVTICVWTAVQYYGGEDATVPFSVFKQRSVLFASAYTIFAAAAFSIVVYYLPIWFQAIKNDSPEQSGIHIIPTVLSVTFCALFAGGMVNYFGYYVPWLFVGSVFMAVGGGLLSMLHPDSYLGTWIGYQILFAAGAGVSLEQCNIAVQASLPPKLIPAGTSIVVFVRAMGGSLGVAIAENIFEQQLRHGLAQRLPHLPDGLISDSGVTDLAAKVGNATGGDQAMVATALEVYSQSINDAFYCAAALAAMTFFCALGVEWRSVKKQKKVTSNEKV